MQVIYSLVLWFSYSSKVHVCVLSCFSCVLLFATLWTVALQAPLSMGFSRQEHWSGVPCPPPVDLSSSGIDPVSLSSLCDPKDCSPPGSSVHGMLQARTLEWVAMSFSRGSSRPRNRTYVSCLAGGFFTTEPPRKHLKFVDRALLKLIVTIY